LVWGKGFLLSSKEYKIPGFSPGYFLMTESPEAQRFWLIAATYTSVGVAVFLIFIKSLALFYTGSASLLGSLLDSFTDSLASIVTLLAVRYSLKPADKEHRFGHGKAEPIAAVVQSAFIMGSGAFLLFYCLEQFANYQQDHIQNTPIGITVMVISTVMTLGLVVFQKQAIKRTNSAAIKADSLHYVSDTFINLSIIAALFAADFGWQKIDLILAVLIAIYIIYCAITIAKDALSALMDKELGVEISQQIIDAALKHKEVYGVHDLRTRQSGTTYIIQLHIELDDQINLFHAHKIADEVEAAIKEIFPSSDVLIHQDPLSVVGRTKTADEGSRGK
jgi:ferrous-iron efflux pump FieF